MNAADTASFEVKSIVGERDFMLRQFYQLSDMTAFILGEAERYVSDNGLKGEIDRVYS